MLEKSSDTKASLGDVLSNDTKTTFISHATEDKGFVKILVDKLIVFGVQVWYDDYEIKAGDSIRRSINAGLRSSRYGVVVLSRNFFKKKWPQQELAALASALEDGRLIPIYHEISHEEVVSYDPLIADFKGLSSNMELGQVVASIASKVRGTQVREDGKAIYRHQTVKVMDIPLSGDQCLEDIVFEDCILVGLAVLTLHEDNVFAECFFNSPDVFMTVSRGEASIGTVGVRRTVFRRSRFKDIGFTVTPEEKQQFLGAVRHVGPEWKPPEHLR